MIGIVLVAFMTARIAYGFAAKMTLHFRGNKLAAEFINPVECALVKPGLQQHVLAVHISGLAQPLPECLGVLVLESLDAADPRKFVGRLLRARH
jgi:hypothetical protein